MLEEHEKLLRVQEAKIIDLDNDLINYTQNLKAVSSFSLERDNLTKEAEEYARLNNEWERLVAE